MKVDGSMIISILKQSRIVGTEDEAIALAEEWIVSAEKEIHKLRLEVIELQDTL